MSKLLILITLLTSSFTTIAFADTAVLESALIKMNRAQILLDEARADIEAALESSDPRTISATAVANPVINVQCSQNNGNNFTKDAMSQVVSNITAQCRGTRGCRSGVTESDIVFSFSQTDTFECTVTGTLYY
ncbi:MAG: hypothetical protein CME65_06955 [Halobacteriovoraceae bacterium]|nr:hypothetical protein [Halobacteriovoraceae bacterium]|tara:strand:+ start:1599 stop:1997 length:399 start_codon:yes stop_codon:yes gene_type:complete